MLDFALIALTGLLLALTRGFLRICERYGGPR
jgi:hypothetical protein